MSKANRLIGYAACILAVGLAVAVYALFHGYFDHGHFQIKQVQWSSSKQAAMVAERSDQQARSSYTYFVLIGDHVFSPSELRHAYYSSSVVFAAADSCLDLHWHGPTELVIACDGHNLIQHHIDVEKNHSGNITIIYENIPGK